MSLSPKREQKIREFYEHDGVWTWTGQVALDLLAEVDRLRAREATRDTRDDWLRKQLDGCIEDAYALTPVYDLAALRALVGNLRDARAALEGEQT